jgi:hypothetical protein
MPSELTIKELRIPQDATEPLQVYVHEAEMPIAGNLVLIWHEAGKGVGGIPPALFWGNNQPLEVYVQHRYGRSFKGWKPVREEGRLRLYPHI